MKTKFLKVFSHLTEKWERERKYCQLYRFLGEWLKKGRQNFYTGKLQVFSRIGQKRNNWDILSEKFNIFNPGGSRLGRQPRGPTRLSTPLSTVGKAVTYLNSQLSHSQVLTGRKKPEVELTCISNYLIHCYRLQTSRVPQLPFFTFWALLDCALSNRASAFRNIRPTTALKECVYCSLSKSGFPLSALG